MRATKTLNKPGRYFLIFIGSLACILFLSCNPKTVSETSMAFQYDKEFKINKTMLKDKIMGGWAGQTIGCTYGGPTEFSYQGTMIQDYIPIEWNDSMMEITFKESPGLYDDIYMDLTFVEVFEKEGLDAPASSHAKAFANAGYKLWHANQAARYNILHGIEPPATGYWENNPHADDIDFQIEADFAGLMNPGMVNSSSEVCNKIGHIMNYGDGWYGGVYVAAMYSLAFVTNDINAIVSEALKTIPEESEFYQCIHDVISWHQQFPEDWKRTWFEIQKKWSSDIGCPDGVFNAFDIDAKINAAYIVIGLLYGNGDFGKTIDISTRCGQDSDCNPASSGGILGVVLGYNKIPYFWKKGLHKVEDIDFKYTNISLNDVYEMSYRHALEMIKRNGGRVEGENITIAPDKPIAVRYERSFKGHYPVKVIDLGWGGKYLETGKDPEYNFTFKGKGFILKGVAEKLETGLANKDLIVNIFIDNELYEQVKLPTAFRTRRHEITWKYNLPDHNHKVRISWKNPVEGYRIRMDQVIVYGPEPD